MLTFGPLTVTGEQARKPTDYDMHDMVRRNVPQPKAPAAAWCEVFWHGQLVGKIERVDWVVTDGSEAPFSTYWFISCSGKTQVAGRDREAVLRNVNEALLELMPTPDALQS